MNTTLTRAELLKLSNQEQIDFFKDPSNTLVEEEVVEGAPVPDASDIFVTEPEIDTSGSSEVVTSEYDIEGDSVFMNADIEIAGQMFRLKGVKLTEKSMCMQSWDREAKEWREDHNDTMSIIDMIRTHGSALVTENAVATVRFGMQGERTATKRDPIAEMLEAQKQAEAEAQAKVDAMKNQPIAR